MASSKTARMAAGVRDTIPMLVGAAPFGVIFGTLAAAGPLAPWQGQLMSLGVFAGSSQFIALGLLAGHAGMLLIWATTVIVNLRHALYGATLLPHVARLPLRWRWLLGFLLTDETFAVVAGHVGREPQASDVHWYLLGSGASMYVNWQFWTLVGLAFGAIFPGLQALGLDFAMAATFIALVVPQLARAPQLCAAVAAGFVAFMARDLPYQLGLFAAVLAGVIVGMAATRWRDARAKRLYRT